MKVEQRSQRNFRGTSTLEFIVVLPFLFILMLTAVELSRMLFIYNTIVQATRDGARVAVVTEPFSTGPAITRINNILAASNITGASVDVSCSTGPCDGVTESTVKVTVTVNFQTLFPLLSSMFSVVPPLTHYTYMRYE
jgi:Flp pilus assembly protein TadG